MDGTPYWKTTPLAEMTQEQWEALCDGCGRCCLQKLRDEDTNELYFTNVACHLLDRHSCRCGDYANRQGIVSDCVSLTPEALAGIDWLPPSCAYRRLAEGRDLPDWHVLMCGDPDAVHRSGASVRGRVISERDAGAWEGHIRAWPGRMPRKAWRAAARAQAEVAAEAAAEALPTLPSPAA